MVQQLLAISWIFEEELAPVPGEHQAGNMLETLGIWRDPPARVKYRARLEKSEKDGDDNKLTLRYRREDQTDQQVLDHPDARWGEAVVSWSTAKRVGHAIWTDDEENSGYDGTVDVVLIGGEKPAGEIRKSVSALVKPRPEQRVLRDRLLCLDKTCVLTGEPLAAALEAAHVIPVKAGGEEVIANAVLLRADLHRMFDAGYFWFDPTRNGAVVTDKEEMRSSYYRDLLDGKRLPDETFARVSDALKTRLELPGSRGRGS